MLRIQDTTELGFNDPQTEGLCKPGDAAQRDIYLFPTFAVSLEHEPLVLQDA